jgi:hypothetical protein
LVNFLKHVDTSAMMDILLRLAALIDHNDLRQNLIEWFKSINLVKSLVYLFKSDYSNDVHSNSSQLICEIIKVTREQIQNMREGNLDPNNYDSRSLSSRQQIELQKQDLSILSLHKESLLEEIES